jgi:hypothetical protein
MFLFRFYRLYLSVLGGAIVFLTIIHSWWAWLGSSIFLRIIWSLGETKINNYRNNKHFEQHSYEFKQLLGPYGIRMINKAESDPQIKKSLCEVFTPDLKKLQETIKQLEMMDALFAAGMRPDSDTYHLHDLKLKYAKHRLQKITNQN